MATITKVGDLSPLLLSIAWTFPFVSLQNMKELLEPDLF
jgi:hypothetical protein